jgi:hypothetical protein
MHEPRRRQLATLTGRLRTALRSPDPSDDLVERVERLESVVEGLQDAMHRESVRHDQQIEALQAKTEPAELARALSEDARKRGL